MGPKALFRRLLASKKSCTIGFESTILAGTRVLDHFQKDFSGKISTLLILTKRCLQRVLTDKQRDLLPKRAWEASWLGGVDGRPGAMLAAVVRLLRKSRRAAEDEGSRRKRNRVLLAACGFACLLLMQLALEEPERRQVLPPDHHTDQYDEYLSLDA